MIEPEWIKSADGLLSIIGTIFVFGFGAFKLIERRQTKRANEVVSDLRDASRTTVASIDRLAARMDGFERDMDRVDDRVTGLEKSMETVARRIDVAQLEISVREFQGQVRAELRSLTNQTNTLYQAAVAASQNRTPKT